ncbi:MAG: hypothetical protein IJ706_04730 [Clostridia bacterium]|nr:hypothetical protein [Clostridia bacterium]
MLLKIKEFESFAESRGYKNGEELLEDMGSSTEAYEIFRQGGRIGSDLVAELYNRFGEENTFQFIDFEEESGSGFKSKYIAIGQKLY